MLFSSLLALAGCACASASPLSTSWKRQAPSGVPDYAITYAPIVYLFDADPYRPSDIGNQLANTKPEVNFTVVSGAPSPLTLDNLNALNGLDGSGGNQTYLTSVDDITTNPTWLNGVAPDSSGKTGDAVSCAIIVNNHTSDSSGFVDVFYMYFYAFNFGGTYVGFTIGDHVGDWEHTMVRFRNGTPQAVWYSQHNNGEAFTYDTVNKYNGGVRPVVFSANGSHANYAINGTHGHGIPDVNLPDGPINDYTNNGPVWDPTLSAYFYSYDASSNSFASYDNSTPFAWLSYTGKWGDEQYPESDKRQLCVFGISALCKYQSGPTGPEDKQLNRTDVCPDNGDLCIVRTELGP